MANRLTVKTVAPHKGEGTESIVPPFSYINSLSAFSWAARAVHEVSVETPGAAPLPLLKTRKGQQTLADKE
jgi:hypothetical protein